MTRARRRSGLTHAQEEIEQLKADGEQEKEKFNTNTKAIADAAGALAVPLKQPGDTLSVIDTGTILDPQLSKIRSFVVQLQNDVFSYKDVRCIPHCPPAPTALQQKAKLESNKAELQKSVEDLQKQLNGTKLSLTQARAACNCAACCHTECRRRRSSRSALSAAPN